MPFECTFPSTATSLQIRTVATRGGLPYRLMRNPPYSLAQIPRHRAGSRCAASGRNRRQCPRQPVPVSTGYAVIAAARAPTARCSPAASRPRIAERIDAALAGPRHRWPAEAPSVLRKDDRIPTLRSATRSEHSSKERLESADTIRRYRCKSASAGQRQLHECTPRTTDSQPRGAEHLEPEERPMPSSSAQSVYGQARR